MAEETRNSEDFVTNKQLDSLLEIHTAKLFELYDRQIEKQIKELKDQEKSKKLEEDAKKRKALA